MEISFSFCENIQIIVNKQTRVYREFNESNVAFAKRIYIIEIETMEILIFIKAFFHTI